MAIESPKTKSLEELIQRRFYHIPLYQRPYSWEIDQVSDLWDDIDINSPGYFIGIVLFKPDSQGSPHPVQFEIVDGQQRIATLLLLLRAAIEVLQPLSSQAAEELQKDYISQRRAATKVEARLTLTLSKQDREKFASLLQGSTFQPGRRLSSWRNLEKAFSFFKEKSENLIKDEGKEGLIHFINEKVLKLSFLEVLLGTDSDVYQFFETLNDRGMDLSIADLVKNSVCAETVKQRKDVEGSVLAIDRISEMLGSGKFKTFLHHYCLANSETSDPIPRNGLMDWYNVQIKNSPDIGNLLQHIERYANQYAEFTKPNKCEDKEKRRAFMFLDALGVSRCYPLLLAGAEKLSKKDFLKLCRAVEVLTFRHSTVLKRDAKVLEGAFYKMIGIIRKGGAVENVLENFKTREAMRTRADEHFRLAFANEFIPINHKVARYALLKIEEEESGKEQVKNDWGDITLEHILAEKLEWDGKDEYLEWMCNLTLLSSKLNVEAANKPFEKKSKEVYRKEKKIEITKELLNYQNFTKDTIIERQKKLADKAVKIWNAKNIR